MNSQIKIDVLKKSDFKIKIDALIKVISKNVFHRSGIECDHLVVNDGCEHLFKDDCVQPLLGTI